MKDSAKKYFLKKSLYQPEDCSDVISCLSRNSEPPVAVVIPVKNEFPGIKDTLSSLSDSAGLSGINKLHVVCVVNCYASDSSDVKENNSEMISFLASCAYKGLYVSLIDRSSAGNELPEKEGVGLARKYGMDYALACGAELIACMDADTIVGKSYVSSLLAFTKNHGKRLFALLPFRHQKAASEKLQAAIDSYEEYMLLHSKKLRETGSPYWAPVLGPSLVATADGYVACGGMNKRAFGEDFYFLQSLEKLEIASGFFIKKEGFYEYSPCFLDAEVYPSARISDRVLFGTGPKVKELSEMEKIDCPVFPDDFYRVAKEFIEKKESCQNELAGFINKENFFSIWNRICTNNPYDEEKREIAFHIWFDGLKIIRAFHSLQK
ncbi:MAG: glycosyltransferase family 2 protein [Treponemataceae bacterium]|nr:glycosyltransferase family 2 protein [Treponemataceae bacterium]